jgi:hypothetical protein
LPRFRYDQLMNFGWRWLMPLAILNIVATSLWLAYADLFIGEIPGVCDAPDSVSRLCRILPGWSD